MKKTCFFWGGVFWNSKSQNPKPGKRPKPKITKKTKQENKTQKQKHKNKTMLSNDTMCKNGYPPQYVVEDSLCQTLAKL
eukprot:m.90146 g.90146  ORF g.90146 m.90146 type:complete len:79 (+) comp26367_c1_seq1:114-350(+)